MAFIDSLPSGLAEWLGGQNELGDIDFTVDFPANIKKTPLRYPVVAVGLKKCTVTPPVDVNGQPVNNIHKEA
ncbi:MAG: hypothetical protein FWF08_04790, partial [Oscillospiraceae bacterium]|nr:hypothetical protein [Oscillospiraceae bacterium]